MAVTINLNNVAKATDLSNHIADLANPHAVTKAQVGLSNVDNVQQYPLSNPSGFETPTQLNARDTANRARANHTGDQAISTITGLQTALDGKEPTISILPVSKGGTGLNALGLALQVLRVNAGGAALEYATIAAGLNLAGSSGQLQFNNGASDLGADSGLFWDNTNKRLQIGTISALARLHVTTPNSTTIGQIIQGAASQSANLTEWRTSAGAGSSTSFVKADQSFEIGNGTITASSPALTLKQTWNSAGTSFTGFFIDITDSGSLTNSSVANFRLGGISIFNLLKSGDITTIGSLTLGNGKAINTQGQSFLNIQTGTGRTLIIGAGGTFTTTSGTVNPTHIQHSFSPTTGTAIWNHLNLESTINQTGGANGISRGLYINPTLTSAADFRAIEVAAGSSLFGHSLTPTAFVDIAAGITANAQIRLRAGVAPTAPNDGDIWFDGTNLSIRIAGVTRTFNVT